MDDASIAIEKEVRYDVSETSPLPDQDHIHHANMKCTSDYMFPNDEKEQDPLDTFHHMFKLALGGKLFLAPVHGESLRVLDIGTGTGIWAIDMGNHCFLQIIF